MGTYHDSEGRREGGWRDDRRDDRRRWDDRRDDRWDDNRDDRWEDRRGDRWDDRDDRRGDRWDDRDDRRDRRDSGWDDRDDRRGDRWGDDRRDDRWDDRDDRWDDDRRDPVEPGVALSDVSLRYRTYLDVRPLKEDGDPFLAVLDLVVDWVVEKELQYEGSPIAQDFSEGALPRAWDYHSPEGYVGGAYDEDRWPALACVTGDDAQGEPRRWVMEYDEPDARRDTRRWHTTVCLERKKDGACGVGIESVCRLIGDEPEPLPEIVAAPSLVRAVIDLPWFVAKRGTTQLQTVPNKLSAQTFSHFTESLLDASRTLPLVLFCTGYDGKMPEQAKQLSRRALGNANVYVIDWSDEELREEELELFKRGTAAGEYACPKSSARMYMAGVDLTDPHHSRTHESWNREALAATRPSQFAEALARRFLPNEPVPAIADLPRLAERDAREAEREAAQAQAEADERAAAQAQPGAAPTQGATSAPVAGQPSADEATEA
ncbi:hypothetical protein I3I95_11290 [bacterium]|nr:hypothetical protein [bacterium]